MIGSIRWNLSVAAAGFVLTFFVSMVHNIFMTSLVQSLLSAVLFFAATFAFRWIFGTLVGLKGMPGAMIEQMNHEEALKGTSYDQSTPDETEELNKLLKSGSLEQGQEGFSPLSPPKLATRQKELDPAQIAGALRHMREEGGDHNE